MRSQHASSVLSGVSNDCRRGNLELMLLAVWKDTFKKQLCLLTVQKKISQKLRWCRLFLKKVPGMCHISSSRKVNRPLAQNYDSRHNAGIFRDSHITVHKNYYQHSILGPNGSDDEFIKRRLTLSHSQAKSVQKRRLIRRKFNPFKGKTVPRLSSKGRPQKPHMFQHCS